MSRASAPIKVHGGKNPLAARILSLFPPRDSYTTLVETHCGGCAVTLAHDGEGKAEIVNDVDQRCTNFFRVLQDPFLFSLLLRKAQATQFSKPEFTRAVGFFEPGFWCDWSSAPKEMMVDWAWAFLVLCRQSLGARQKDFSAPVTSRVRRGMSDNVSAWLSAIDGLPEAHARCLRWYVDEMGGSECARKYDKPGVVLYVDPPYPAQARVAKNVYHCEMTDEQHGWLVDELNGLQHARALVSGYSHPIYESGLKKWNRHEIVTTNKSSHAKIKPQAIEIVWTNF